jgi:hypothetical protein
MSDLVDFIGEIKTQLDRLHLAYKAYINGGKIFLYAKILKTSNDELRDLLIRKTHLLPIEQIPNAVALIHHIDVWSTLWEDAYLSLKPSMFSVFVFNNEVNFPAKNVQSLFAYYDKVTLWRDSTLHNSVA